MNLLLEALMDKPSIIRTYCVPCQAMHRDPHYALSNHHVVPRSQGGLDGPRITHCGSGTTGCHGLAEDKRLHWRWEDGWQFIELSEPTKYLTALDMDGWIRGESL